MSKEMFIYKTFNPKHRRLIETADSIMSSYTEQGYDLSLRQLYYQFVAHHDLPNTEQSYKMLGGVISDARLAGLLDWECLVDRGRSSIVNPHWSSPGSIIKMAANGYRIDLWEDQSWHVEVMVEKQALEGVLVPVCRNLDVRFTANKGYSSSSAMYQAGRRLEQNLKDGKDVAIIYLGDHDPSGIDMTRDVEGRLALFSGAGFWADSPDQMEEEGIEKPQVILHDEYQGRFIVERVALNMDQIRTYNPPPNPAKTTDSRAWSYIENFGRESWELDALEPSVLADLVTEQVERFIDFDLFDARKALMEEQRKELLTLSARYDA